MKKIIINTSTLSLCLILSYSMAFGQKNKPFFSKIIISSDSLVYYSICIDATEKAYEDYDIYTVNEIYKKKKDSQSLIFKDVQLRREKFGDSEVDANFLIVDSSLIVLSLQKTSALYTKSEIQYWMDPWVVRYKCINVTNKKNVRSNSFFSPVIQLDHGNFLYSFQPKPIFYDFFKHKNDIFLMILANHTLYLYQSAGSLDENQWQLKKTFSGLKYQSFFRAYKEDSCNLILDFGSDESYCIDLENESATLIETDPHENKCLVHNQLTNEFLWLTPTQAKELIAEDDPVMYINQFKQE